MKQGRAACTMLVVSVAAAVKSAHAQTGDSSPENMFVLLLFFVVYIGALAIFVAPIIIAFYRHHPNRWPIFGVNIFLGGTGIGWFGALIWSLSAVHRSNLPSGSHGGESGLNIYANDPVTLRIEPSPEAPSAILAPNSPPPPVGNAMTRSGDADLFDRLERLKRLHESGAVDDDQFKRLRNRLVGEMG